MYFGIESDSNLQTTVCYTLNWNLIAKILALIQVLSHVDAAGQSEFDLGITNIVLQNTYFQAWSNSFADS